MYHPQGNKVTGAEIAVWSLIAFHIVWFIVILYGIR